MESVWGALADPTRWRILELLRGGEMSSGEIAKAFALRWPTVSRHLAVLEEAGLVRKGIRGRRRVYAADGDGLARAVAALRHIGANGDPHDREKDGNESIPSTMGTLIPVDVFIGRERQLEELTTLLDETRTLTIAGAPGVGKTRLARELATRVASSFADGVRWVELARVIDPVDVVQAIATVFEVKERAGQTPLDALIAHLRTKNLLLVLDNAEHVRQGCAEAVESITARCARVTVLTTSQAELEATAETVWRLTPLSLSAGDGADIDSEAVQLFTARARMIRPDFAVDVEGQRAVDELCRRLDGIPLAIELAAARVGVLTPHEIAERLSDRFALLASPRETDLERHQTLRGALAWSHGLLSPSQQQLLRRMSVFVGTADLNAIETVCGPEADAVLTDLAHLVAGSLVICDTTGPRARYRLLECIRAYGAEQVAAHGEAETLRSRHLEWFTELAERAEPAFGGVNEQTWLNQLEADVDNLRSALAWAAESGDAGAALRMAAALTLYWRVRSRFREGRRWFDTALGMGDGHAPSLLMRAHWGAGFMALMLNDLSAAIGHLDSSLALALETADTRGQARALLLLGNAWMLRPPPIAAPAPGVAGMLTQSATLARTAGDAWCRAHALSLLGWMRLRAGDTAAARKPLEEALAVSREASDRQGLRLSLTMLGRLAQTENKSAAAERFLAEAVDVSDELGDAFGVGAALTTLSEIALQRGDYGHAVALLGRAARALKEAGPSAFRAVYGLGSVALARGDIDEARRRFEAAAADADETNEGRAQIGLGLLALVDADLRAAQTHFEKAQTGQDSQADAEALSGLASVARVGGDLLRAASLEHSALEMRSRLRDTPGMVESLENLACIASAGGRHDHAARLFGAVNALSTSAGLVRPHLRQRQLDIAVSATRRELGRSAFRASFAAGEALSLRNAISYATRGRGARRRPRSGWGSLTQMERAVVAQAIQGLSNAEIAKQLFISPHTAAWHLSQVYAKLGINSRTQLAYHVALRSDPGRNNP